jgi:hypothetical protein
VSPAASPRPILTEQTRPDNVCPGCEKKISFKILQSSNPEAPVLYNVMDEGRWLGLFVDEEGNTRLLLFCSDACAKKILSEET